MKYNSIYPPYLHPLFCLYVTSSPLANSVPFNFILFHLTSIYIPRIQPWLIVSITATMDGPSHHHIPLDYCYPVLVGLPSSASISLHSTPKKPSENSYQIQDQLFPSCVQYILIPSYFLQSKNQSVFSHLAGPAWHGYTLPIWTQLLLFLWKSENLCF